MTTLSGSTSSSSNSSASNRLSTVGFRYCGLANLGETCYSNACLQALYTLNKIRCMLISFRVTGGPFHVSLGRLFHEMNESQASDGQMNITYTRPVQFNDHFRLARPEFILNQQHDAQEFLTFLLDILHRETNRPVPPPANFTIPTNRDEAWIYHQTYLDTSHYAKIFMGQAKSLLTCNSCGHRSITWSCFWQLQLHLPESPEKDKTLITVNDCIREFMADETLQGDCAPTCGGCNQRNGSTKKQTVCQAPVYLIVHLKRFGPTGQKIQRKVPFDQSLSLANRYYELTACVMHYGIETKGHYTTLYYEDTNRWVLFDDDKVDNQVTDQRARKWMEHFGYIGFYRAVVLGS